MNDCLFCKIIAKEIPVVCVYEDDEIFSFLDNHPVNPGHTLVLPKKHSEGFHDADRQTLQSLILATQKIATAVLAAVPCVAFTLQQNNGSFAGQSIHHLHFHIIPRLADDGLQHWPGQDLLPEQGNEIGKRISASIT